MKFAVFLGLLAVARAGVVAPLTGSSTVSRSEDGAGNYAFSYDEGHATGGSFRRESGSPGAVTGSYGLRDADGRIRTVNYIADAAGFRASISTNEPGVEPKSPADTLINGVAPDVHVAAPVAPVVAAPAAPIVHRAAAPVFAQHSAPFITRAAPVLAAPAVAAPVVAAPVVAAPVVAAPAFTGYSYQSSVNHAIPARIAAPLLAAPAIPAPAIAAPIAHAPVAAPIRVAQPWGFTSQW